MDRKCASNRRGYIKTAVHGRTTVVLQADWSIWGSCGVADYVSENPFASREPPPELSHESGHDFCILIFNFSKRRIKIVLRDNKNGIIKITFSRKTFY